MRLIFKGTNYLPEYRGLHDGRLIYVLAGSGVEVSDDAATVLLRDFPGVFVLAEPQVRAFDGPPQDKMIRGAKKK